MKRSIATKFRAGKSVEGFRGASGSSVNWPLLKAVWVDLSKFDSNTLTRLCPTRHTLTNRQIDTHEDVHCNLKKQKQSNQ